MKYICAEVFEEVRRKMYFNFYETLEINRCDCSAVLTLNVLGDCLVIPKNIHLFNSNCRAAVVYVRCSSTILTGRHAKRKRYRKLGTKICDESILIPI